MKRYSIFTLALVLCLSSCEGFLGKRPVSSLTSELFWKTEDDVEAAKAAMYSAMATAMEVNFFQWGELRGHNWGGQWLQRNSPDSVAYSRYSQYTRYCEMDRPVCCRE